MERQDQRIGLLSAVPMGAVLLISFLAPLMVIAIFSVMPQKVFSLLHLPDFSSYKLLFTQGYIKSVLWSFGMAMASTAILFVICWPLAFGMAKVFKLSLIHI